LNPPAPQQMLLVGAQRLTLIITLLVGALAFSLNARGTILEGDLQIQTFALDRYKVQWITGVGGVAGLVSLFTSVYLIKVWGIRRTYLLGVFCLTIGSLGEALSRTYWEVGVAVAVRSCAGFYAIPGVTLFQRLFTVRRRFAYCSYITMIYGGQVIVEPIGALLAFNPSWRTLFVGIGGFGVGLLLIAFFLFPREQPDRKEHSFDFVGMFLFTVILALILFLFYRGNYLGWGVSTPIVVAVMALMVSLGLFILCELIVKEPFVHLGGFTYRTVALAMLCSAFWCASMYGVSVQLPQCLLALGYEHWKAGWVILPMGVIVVVAMLLSGFVRDRAELVWLLRIGLAGMTAVGFWLSRVDIYTPWQWVMMVSSLWAVFTGMCMSPMALLPFQGQDPTIAAVTGPMKFFMRTFNGTVGIVLAGILIDRGAWWGLEFVRDGIIQGQGAVQADIPEIRDHLARHGSGPEAVIAQEEAVLGYWVNLHAQVIGYRLGLRYCAYLSAAGLVLALLIHRRKEISIYDSA
jgi:MFS family permease